MRSVIAASFLVACLASASAFGLETGSSRWSFNGYGTLGVVHSDEDRADYVPDFRLTSGPGRSTGWDPDVDSRIGAQLSVYPTRNLSAVVQVVSEKGSDGAYTPEVEWANLTYTLSPSFRVRAGRIAVGLSMASEYRKVGFAMPWVRPPPEVYRMLPVTHSDGVDATYTFRRGGLTYEAQVAWGISDDDVGEAKAFGLHQTIDWRALRLKLSYARVDLDISEFTDFFEAFELFGEEGRRVVRRYDLDSDPLHFAGLSVSYDPGNWFATAEWLAMRSDTIIGDAANGYVSAGVRFGALTPYATFARAKRQHSTAVDGLTVSAQPPPLAPVAAGLNDVIGLILRAAPDQRTLSLGTRWDVTDRIALKAQYDFVDVTDGSPGHFTNQEPGFQPGRVDLFSLSLDFLF